MTKVYHHRRGLSLIELMAATLIMITLATIGLRLSSDVLRQHRVVNQVKWVKTTVLTARGRAIENTAPVRVVYDPGDNSLFAEIDMARDGRFGVSNTRVLIDKQPSPYEQVIMGTPTGMPTLINWMDGVSAVGPYNGTQPLDLTILPDGRVMETATMRPALGALFFYVDVNDSPTAAVQFTATGQLKLAFNGGKKKDGTNWNDWVWID